MTPQITPGSGATATFRKAQQEARIRSSHVGIPAHPSTSPPRSGVQPDARGMVLCPFCNKTFPFSAALLDRQLRCSGCRSIFRVAGDRRSFRIQAANAQPSAEAGTLSKLTRSAIRNANASLNEAAAEALRALGGQDRPPPPGSRSKLPTHAGSTTDIGTRSVRRAKQTAILTGEGLNEGKRRQRLRTILTAVAACLLAATALAWWSGSDPRVDALWRFQGEAGGYRTWAAGLAAMRAASLSESIEPVVGLERARLSTPLGVDAARLREALSGMRVLRRGVLWVEASRSGEATALLGAKDLSDAKALEAFLAACRKDGISVRTWPETITVACQGQPAEAAEALTLLLNRTVPRRGGFDPITLLEEGKIPDHIRICAFSGEEGALLQPSGPATSPIAYHGRLIRCTGPGWPNDWAVLDLAVKKP